MALRLIRRHLKDCSHTSSKYRRCKCPIHVYGTLGGEKIRAVKKFFDDCEARKLGWEAMRKYRHLLDDRFLPWTDRRGLNNLRQITVDGLRQLRQTWRDGALLRQQEPRTNASVLSLLHQAGWIRDNPAKAVKAPKVPSSPTLPFSRAEMKSIVEACDEYGGDRERIKALC